MAHGTYYAGCLKEHEIKKLTTLFYKTAGKCYPNRIYSKERRPQYKSDKNMNRGTLSKTKINDQKMPGWFEGSALFLDFQKRGGALSIINGFGIDGLITFMANSSYISLRALDSCGQFLLHLRAFLHLGSIITLICGFNGHRLLNYCVSSLY